MFDDKCNLPLILFHFGVGWPTDFKFEEFLVEGSQVHYYFNVTLLKIYSLICCMNILAFIIILLTLLVQTRFI